MSDRDWPKDFDHEIRECGVCGLPFVGYKRRVRCRVCVRGAATMTEPCVNCEGTGKVILSNSWIVADGYRKERCGICGGSGENPKGYTAWHGHAAFLKQAHENMAKWGGLLRPPLNWS